jgi:Fe-S-cluster containining protein
VSTPPSIRSTLSPVYQRLFPEVFDHAKVHESRATCDACQMCDHGTVPSELSASYFRPDTKCCTYFPTLPNYLVGAILADKRSEMDEGKKRIREQIAARLGVHPQRLAPSKKWALLYRSSMESSFGRSRLLRCPYLTDDERCSIWYHRESVCFTFYCKFDNGVAGSLYWRALKGYLNVAEEALSTWAAKQVAKDVRDPRQDETASLSLTEFEERPIDPAIHAKYWGSWVGKEEELYIACYERVKRLTQEEYAKIVDASSIGKERLEKLQDAVKRVREAPKIPERVSLNKRLRVLPVQDGVVITMPYNNYDSIKIEPELHDVLKAFTHEETLAETRAKLETEQGIELEDALLSMFAMHDILVAPPKGGICDPVAPTKLSLGRRCATPLKKHPDDL